MKRLFLPLALLALLCGGGCRIIVDDGGGGGGSSQYDDDGGSGDDGYHDDSGGDDGYHDDTAEAEPEPEPARRPPRRKKPKKRVVRGGKRFVGGYRSAYPKLPDLGKTQSHIWAVKTRMDIDRGYLRGDFKGHGGGFIKKGAGHGQTVIDGHCEIRGDNWRLSGVTITGNVDIRGNNNDLSGCQVFGRVKIRGSGNKTP